MTCNYDIVFVVTTWHKMKLNCHVVGFNIGYHEAIITVSWIFFFWTTTVLQIECYNGLMTANVKTNHMTV